MRLVRMAINSIALLLISGFAWGQGTEELGHHWDMPEYKNEMRAQVVMMISLTFVVFAVLWLKQTLKNRRAKQ